MGGFDLPLARGLALVLALEPLHAPGGGHELLLAGVEGVTLRTHLHPDFRPGRTGPDDFSARARDGGVDVVRMNASLHGPPPEGPRIPAAVTKGKTAGLRYTALGKEAHHERAQADLQRES